MDCVYCKRDPNRLSEEHAKTCSTHQDRIQLYRIGELAQRIFYLWREATHNRDNFMIKSVERKPLDPSQLYLYPESKTAQANLDIYGNGYQDVTLQWLNGRTIKPYENPKIDVKDFPAHLFSTENDMKAALAWSYCRSAARFFMEFYTLLPSEFIKDTKMITHDSKGEHLLLRLRSLPPAVDLYDTRPWWRMCHTVLKVALRSGEEYAVDLAGAQFGHFEPVVSWKAYVEERCAALVKSEPAQFIQGLFQLHDYSKDTIDRYRRRLPETYQSNTNRLENFLILTNMWTLEWQSTSDISIESFWHCSNEQLLSSLVDLMDSLHVSFGREGNYFDYRRTSHGTKLMGRHKTLHLIPKNWSSRLELLDRECKAIAARAER